MNFRDAPITNFNQIAQDLAGPQMSTIPRGNTMQVNGVTGFQRALPGTSTPQIRTAPNFRPQTPQMPIGQIPGAVGNPGYFNLQDFLSQLNGPGFGGFQL